MPFSTKVISSSRSLKSVTVLYPLNIYFFKLTQNSKNKNEEKNSKFKVIAKSGENKNNKKLTYKLEFELNSLPSKIKNIENDINDFNAKLSDPNLYLNEPDIFFEITKKLEKSKEDLEYFENRWLELEEIKNF